MQERLPEAKAVIERLHSTLGDTQHEYATQEFLGIQRQVLIDRTLGSGRAHMFRIPSYRKRAFLAVGTTAIIQCSGLLVINS